MALPLIAAGGAGLKAATVGKAASGLFGSALSGVGSALGGIASGLFGKSSAKRQMKFQERMSSTAHQRQVKDLRAAGLNPILSANSGASSPGGASSTMADPITPALSSAREAARNRAEVQNLKDQNKLIQANTAETSARTTQTQLATHFLPMQIEAQLEQVHSAAAQASSQTALNNLSAILAGMRNDIFQGDKGRELLISTMGGRATAIEGLRQGWDKALEGVRGTPERSSLAEALQRIPGLLLRPPVKPSGQPWRDRTTKIKRN